MTDIANRSERLLVFDGDDTLWDTQELYTAAKTRIFEYLERFDGSPTRIAEYFEAEDLGNVATLGFTLRRFERSIRNTIEAFSPQGLDDARNVDALIASVLESIEEGPTPLVSGARRLLDDLEPLYRLVLMTKGDPMLQEHRISGSGLRQLFERVYIVDEKTPAGFQRILKETRANPNSAWSIGNSLRSDIRPAIMVGMKGIWIEKATWAWEDAANHADQSIFKVRGLQDVRSVLIPIRG
jgi:putative hydrolase of the HAD superfamily